MQEGVSQQAPDLAVQDVIDVELEGAGEPTQAVLDGPTRQSQDLDDEGDDVDADQPLADAAALPKGTQEARPFPTNVIAVVNPHERSPNVRQYLGGETDPVPLLPHGGREGKAPTCEKEGNRGVGAGANEKNRLLV